ncbi:MAG: hypothetical protein O3B75_05085 [Planctomycetota bacterium]|nr:hypothetical protein [Planctomycetota bacterium]
MRIAVMVAWILCTVLQASSPTQTVPTSKIPPSLLRPIPSTGGIQPAVDPAILKPSDGTAGTPQSYERSAKDFVQTKFGTRRGATRIQNIALLNQWKDPSSWQPLWDAMKKEKDDVRLAFLDHLASQGGLGQGMLAKIAIRSEESTMRHEASRRIVRPACDEVIAIIELGLRDERHIVVNQSGLLAGKVDAFAVIPSLIFAQVTADEKKTKGDLAWIAIGSNTHYIANVTAVVGDNSGAFIPVIGNLQTGVLMRVQDAMVYNYRSDAHQSLISLTSRDFGQSTADMGWDMKRWWTWFNTEYLPFKQAQAASQIVPVTDPEKPDAPQSPPPTAPPAEKTSL